MSALKQYQLPPGKVEQYTGSGSDIAGVSWALTVTLTRINAAIFGTIEWRGTEVGNDKPTLTGIEHIMGEIDDKEGCFEMIGFELENNKGLETGHYIGNCNKDRMVGHWDDKKLGGNFAVIRTP